MAAIICQGMTKCCDFFCSLPCKVCETGCRAMSSPVSAFVITTVLLQLPIVILSGMDFNSSAFGFGKESGSCKGADWLIGMFIVSVISILISLYLSYRVTNGTDITLRDNNRHSSYERISYLLCHDPIIAFYILVWLFFIAWLIVGSFWSMTNQMDNNSSDTTNIDSRCNIEIETNVGIVLGLGWTYLIVGPTVLSCVLCCACFSKRDYVASDAEFAAMAAKANNNNNNNNDIEMANMSSPPTQTLPLPTTAKLESKTSAHSSNHNSSQYITKDTNTPPRTYSVEGIPIDEVKNNNNNRTSYVAEKQQQAPPPSDNTKIPEVVAEEIPPPMLPPATAPRTNANNNNNNTTTLPTSAAEDTATDVINSVTNTIGGWFKGGKSSNNKKDGPEMKATVY